MMTRTNCEPPIGGGAHLPGRSLSTGFGVFVRPFDAGALSGAPEVVTVDVAWPQPVAPDAAQDPSWQAISGYRWLRGRLLPAMLSAKMVDSMVEEAPADGPS